MKKHILILALLSFIVSRSIGQEMIPMDTAHWEISGAYIFENYKGKKAIYNQGGSLTLKDRKFINGTIEFDLYLKDAQSFPGVYFRMDEGNGEQFYVRPHLSGKPDANQAAPLINGISPWQLNFGPKYSFVYNYKYDDWTHVKVVVNNDKAQVFLDHATKPNLSWYLYHTPKEGNLIFTGGRIEGLHIADIKINSEEYELVDFDPIERKSIDGLVPEWEISDKFEEKLLDDPSQLESLISSRTWGRNIQVVEGTAANISQQQVLRNGKPGNTVFARIKIDSKKDQLKLFEFGYSDRVIAILNGVPIYKGTNKWQSRDYRYLGTIGLFDAIYLNLKKGENTLLMAVSEDFGGWLITGRMEEEKSISIK